MRVTHSTTPINCWLPDTHVTLLVALQLSSADIYLYICSKFIRSASYALVGKV